MSNEKMRADHEAWFSAEYKATYRDKLAGDYDACVFFAHSECGWTASRAALCVELPHICDYIDTYKQGDNRDAYLTDLRDAIESTGVRVK